MNKSVELLNYARNNYPIGTIFNCLHKFNGGPIKIEDYDYNSKQKVIRVLNGSGCIYDKRFGWAKIISSPKLKEIEYEIY